MECSQVNITPSQLHGELSSNSQNLVVHHNPQNIPKLYIEEMWKNNSKKPYQKPLVALPKWESYF